MKMSRLSQTLVLIMPIFTVIASAGIVTHQTLRRDSLQRRMDAFEKEHAVLEKRYKALRKAAGEPEAADTAAGEGEAHHHHDGDGD